MQATVSAYDEKGGSGAVLLDDGRELAFDPEALAGTGLRFLRPGQRVRVDLDPTNRVRRVQILTLR